MSTLGLITCTLVAIFWAIVFLGAGFLIIAHLRDERRIRRTARLVVAEAQMICAAARRS